MRVIVADDAVLLREGLVGILAREGHEVLAQAGTAAELEQAVAESVERGSAPDVVITDVRMPPTMSTEGLDAAVRLRSRHPGLGILLLSQYRAPAYASALFSGASSPPAGMPGVDGPEIGGLGYLLKERVTRVSDFLRSLQVVATGGVVIDPEVASMLVSSHRSTLRDLSAREREVLELMAEGLSNTQIAERLFLSAGTVSKHVANVFAKLQLPPGEENRRVRAVVAYLTAQDG